MAENVEFGIILTMVTSTMNPKQKTYVHVNDIKYHSDAAVDIGCGSIFVPLTKSDIEKCEKS